MFADQLTDVDSDLVAAAKAMFDCLNEKRKEVRTPLTLPCRVVPIDKHNNPNGNSFTAVTTDISPNGLSLLHSAPVKPQLIMVTISKPPNHTLQFVADIVRCGSVNGYYRIGAKLIQKVDPQQ